MSAPSLEVWLADREPAPPAALARRMRELLGAAALAGPASPGTLVGAAADVLGRLLMDGCDTRASALDLLAADALATYAFEAAGDAPSTLRAEAARAMSRIARVADANTGAGSA